MSKRKRRLDGGARADSRQQQPKHPDGVLFMGLRDVTGRTVGALVGAQSPSNLVVEGAASAGRQGIPALALGCLQDANAPLSAMAGPWAHGKAKRNGWARPGESERERQQVGNCVPPWAIGPRLSIAATQADWPGTRVDLSLDGTGYAG
jgi:hypothetical protein